MYNVHHIDDTTEVWPAVAGQLLALGISYSGAPIYELPASYPPTQQSSKQNSSQSAISKINHGRRRHHVQNTHHGNRIHQNLHLPMPHQ